MDNNELISIIMPAYNCEKYISETIKSVINQTYERWELIVIDDCSTDRTCEIIQRINDKRIRFYKNNSNSGVSYTRNKAISLAKGNLIAFLDSDDLWLSDKLEKQLGLMKYKKCDFSFTGASYINENGKFYNGIFRVPSKVDYKKLRMHNVISCSSVIIKKEFLQKVKMQRDDIHEDYATWLKILREGNLAYGLNEPLLIYRISRNSRSGNKLKTIKKTYKVFRFIGINPMFSFYYMCNHILKSIKKYRNIKI